MEIERERMRRKYIDRYERDRDRGMDHRRRRHPDDKFWEERKKWEAERDAERERLRQKILSERAAKKKSEL